MKPDSDRTGTTGYMNASGGLGAALHTLAEVSFVILQIAAVM
jgi:hypothetical protein